MPRVKAAAPILSPQVSGSRYFFPWRVPGGRAGFFPAYGGFERCNPDFLVQREAFPYPSLELVVAGAGSVRLNGSDHPLRAGSLFAYDATTRLEIRTDPQRPLAKYFLCLEGAKAGKRLRAAGLRPGGLLQIALFTEVQRLWDELIREGGHRRRAHERLGAALTEVLLLKIEGLAGHPASPGHTAEQDFLRCKGLIETQAAGLATVQDITRVVETGPSKLGRLFRRYQGMSPYQFLLHRKMALAAELLMNPSTLVKEAAVRVGFADPYHFSRCFKQVHRIAPKEFQRSLRTG